MTSDKLRLFDDDDIERDDMRLADFNAPRYPYLNHTARSGYAYLRNLLQQWFDDYAASAAPSKAKQLCGEFKSQDDKQHLSAFFEIYLYRLLARMGFHVEPEPENADGHWAKKERHPDFRLTPPCDEKILLEATAYHPWLYPAKNDVQKMIDKLNAILQPSDFDLNIRIRSLSTNDLPYAKLSRQVETWLSELDVNDAVQRAVTTGGMDFEKLNSFRYKCDGWDMKFIAKSKKLVGEGERAGPSLRIIYPVFTSPISDSIRKKIKGKASRYGELSLPYIIALNVDFPFSVYNVEEVFGVTLNSETGKFIQDHNPNGIWGGPKTYQHKRVSGVSLFRSLRPETMLAEPVLWHHPKANNPLPPDLWPFDQQIFNIEQGYYELREGRQSAVESLGIDVKRMPK